MKQLISISFALFGLMQFLCNADPSIDSQPICTSGKLDLVLVVDVSGSSEQRFINNRDSALEIAKSLPIDWDHVVVAVIQYSKIAVMKLQFGSTQNIDIVNDTISTLDWTGGVAFAAEAMDLAMIQFRRARRDSSRVIVLFSDGNSLNSWNDVQATAERLRYSNAKIHAVSLGNTDERELKAYIGQSNGTIIKNRNDLSHLKQELMDYTVASCRGAGAPPAGKSSAFQKGGEPEDHSINDKLSTDKHPMSRTDRPVPVPVRKAGPTPTPFVAFPKSSTPVPATGSHKPAAVPPRPVAVKIAAAPHATTTTTTTLSPEAREEAIKKQVDKTKSS